MEHALIQFGLVLAAVAGIALSPFGRRTLAEVGRDGLMPMHVRHLIHVMAAVALLVTFVAALNVH